MSQEAELGARVTAAPDVVSRAITAYLEVAHPIGNAAPRAESRAFASQLLGATADVRTEGLGALRAVACAVQFTFDANVITDTWRVFDDWHVELTNADDD